VRAKIPVQCFLAWAPPALPPILPALDACPNPNPQTPNLLFSTASRNIPIASTVSFGLSVWT
jgi:hypothetical protein